MANLAAAGHDVVFATPDGCSRAGPIRITITGVGLDFLGRVPGLRQLRLVGLAILRADRNARLAHCELVDNAAFCKPLRYAALDHAGFDALLLPASHAHGMREYLESDVPAGVAGFFDAGKPAAAICHGVGLAARQHLAAQRTLGAAGAQVHRD